MYGELTDRRNFLKKSSVILPAVMTATMSKRVYGANDRIVAGIMGCGGRGRSLAVELAKHPGIDIAYVCDADSRRLERIIHDVEQTNGQYPKGTMDFRHILDDGNVDLLINATPDHWHALGTIMACQAGKDVYVEKPLTHNIWEGQKVIEAVKKYKRIVQFGTQNRSAPYVKAAQNYIRNGKLGSVYLIRVLNMKNRSRVSKKADEPTPEGVNYDMWLGPAPNTSFNPNHFHGYWHWYWNYSGGDIINDGIHQIDLARMLIDKGYPKSVYSLGGKYNFDDDQETPDTQHVLYEYDGITMTFELTLWTSYMQKTPGNIRDTDRFPKWLFNATRIEIYGTSGMMMMGRHGGGWQVFGDDGKEISALPGRMTTDLHIDNLLECIKSRKQPNGRVEEGHISTVLCHLGNISYRLGGRKLIYDPKTEKFTGDEEADTYLKREYRKPWVIPEKV